jgi:hypothetical protein
MKTQFFATEFDANSQAQQSPASEIRNVVGDLSCHHRLHHIKFGLPHDGAMDQSRAPPLGNE